MKSSTLVLLALSIVTLIRPLEGSTRPGRGIKRLSNNCNNSVVSTSEHKQSSSSGGTIDDAESFETLGKERKGRKGGGKTVEGIKDSYAKHRKTKKKVKTTAVKDSLHSNREKERSGGTSKDSNSFSKKSHTRKHKATPNNEREHRSPLKGILVRTPPKSYSSTKQVKFSPINLFSTNGKDTTTIRSEDIPIDWVALLRKPQATKEAQYRRLISKKQAKVTKLETSLTVLHAKMNAIRKIDKDLAQRQQETANASQAQEPDDQINYRLNSYILHKDIERRNALSKAIGLVVKECDAQYKKEKAALEELKQQALSVIESEFLESYGLDAI